MKLEDFHIDLNKYQNDSFQFQLKLDDTFFGLKENSLFNNCDIDLQVNCSRMLSTVSVQCQLKGVVYTNCDRCLEPIGLRVELEFSEAFKLTQDKELLLEDNYISDTNPVLDIYDLIYEHICLQLPNRLICENSTDPKECEIPSEQQVEKQVDPRWAELKKLIK